MVISFFINNLSTLNLHFEFCLKCINEHVWSYNAFLKCIVNQFGWQLVTCKCLCLNPNPFSPFFPLIIWPFIAVSGPSMKKNRKKIPWKSWSQLEPILLSLSGIFFFFKWNRIFNKDNVMWDLTIWNWKITRLDVCQVFWRWRKLLHFDDRLGRGTDDMIYLEAWVSDNARPCFRW